VAHRDDRLEPVLATAARAAEAGAGAREQGREHLGAARRARPHQNGDDVPVSGHAGSAGPTPDAVGSEDRDARHAFARDHRGERQHAGEIAAGMAAEVEHQRPALRHPRTPFAQELATEAQQFDPHASVRHRLDGADRGCGLDPADAVGGRMPDRQQTEPVRPCRGEPPRCTDRITAAVPLEGGTLRGREVEPVEQGRGGRGAGEQRGSSRQQERPHHPDQWQ
jgi:hypothetical protein